MASSPVIVLQRGLRDAAVTMARASLPREVCALLAGPALPESLSAGGVVELTDIVRVRNKWNTWYTKNRDIYRKHEPEDFDTR